MQTLITITFLFYIVSFVASLLMIAAGWTDFFFNVVRVTLLIAVILTLLTAVIGIILLV